MSADNIAERLAEPFDPDQISWKPQAVKGNRALAIAYIDARAAMNRLDSVLGVGNWQTTYREMGDGVVCHLRVRLNGEWSEHEDVGSQSEQPDGGDRLKAAFSDALKRVAVHLGVGRYLYDLPHQWVDYDPQKKQFVKTPALPDWARPKGQAKARPEPTQAAPAASLSKVKAEIRNDNIRLLGQLVGEVAGFSGKSVAEVTDFVVTAHGLAPGSDLSDLNNEQMLKAIQACEARVKKGKAKPVAQPA